MRPALAWLGFEWARPGAAWALLLPVLCWLLARRRGRSAQVWTGTLAIWREIASEARAARVQAGRLPWAVRLLLLALVAGAVALAGPRRTTAPAARTWTLVLDRSPSMGLAWRAPGGDPSAVEQTRMERALLQAAGLLEELRRSGDAVEWVCEQDGAWRKSAGERPPDEWTRATRAAGEPDWAAFDLPGCVWVSDAASGIRPAHAGLALSGGGAVPGPVALLPGLAVEWDGRRLEERPAPRSTGAVAVEPGVPAAVVRVIEAWAEARGLEVRAQGDDVRLYVVQLAASGPAGGDAVLLERDGWSWSARPRRSAPAGETWLASARLGRPVVAWVPGRIELAFESQEEPRGDSAAFAVSWSDLLDRSVLAPPGVVELRERLAAGEPAVLRPAPEGEERGARGAGWTDGALAGLGLLLCVAALGLRARA